MRYDVNAIIGAVKTTVTLTVAYLKSSLGLDHFPPPPPPWGGSSKLIPQVHTAKYLKLCVHSLNYMLGVHSGSSEIH